MYVNNRLNLFILFIVAVMSQLTPLAAEGLSQDPEDRLYTVPHNVEMQSAIKNSNLDLVIVQHEGWKETLPSFALLKIYEITGRKKIHGQDPVYTTLSMMFQQDRWREARIIPVEHPDLLEMMELDGKWVTPNQVLRNPNISQLIAFLEENNAKAIELKSIRDRLSALEQVYRLGRSERVLKQQEMNDVTSEELNELLDNPEKVQVLHERRRELEEEIKLERPLKRAAEKLIERPQLLLTLRQQFLIVPDSEAADMHWVRPVQLNYSEPSPLFVAGRNFETGMMEAFLTQDPGKIAPTVDRFLDVIEQSRFYPSETFRRAQNLYVLSNPYKLSAAVYLLCTICFGLFLFFQNRKFYWAGYGIMVVGFLIQTAAVGLRLYLKGHVPVSNMFEAITFSAWAVMLIAVFIELYNRKALVGIGSTVMAFLFLAGAAMMPLHETRIHPLRAVLNSYWLNIHVTMMLLSYAAFAISAFVAGVYLIRSLEFKQMLKVSGFSVVSGAVLMGFYGGLLLLEPFLMTSIGALNMLVETIEIFAFLLGLFFLTGAGLGLIAALFQFIGNASGFSERAKLMPLDQTEEFAYRLVQLGWPILTLGITLGAVWADTAWGRFWGWDPKETWAFITWVTYTVYLHMRMVMGWRGRWSAVACIIGFVMVLITMLGVSYLPWFSGGLHSYASPT